MNIALTGHTTPAERLAQGFVEATTEWDFAELSEGLRDMLIAVARAFIDEVDPRKFRDGGGNE